MTRKQNISSLGRWLLGACGLIVPLAGMAQEHGRAQFRVRDNVMYITLPRHLSTAGIDGFTARYNLAGIGLHQLIQTGKDDSIRAMGWKLDSSRRDIYALQKPLQSYGDLHGSTGTRIIFTPIPTPDDWRVIGGNRVVFGHNDFRTGRGFAISGDTVYFVLRGHGDASMVRLAGNFTNWQHGAFPMMKNDSGWSVAVRLAPGPYYYKFILDEDDWTTDPDNGLTENDGRGNENSLFYVPNKTFVLKGHENAAAVYIGGSFNNWAKDGLRLERAKDGWKISMYLEPGTYKYSYYVDGVAIGDGEKGQPLELSLGDKYMFRIRGFAAAKKVLVAGDFNNWAPGEIQMARSADGWEAPYALGPGNYQYKFIVDGRWLTDPANPQVLDDGRGNSNSFLVIGENHTFRLKGRSGARSVNITGDFIDWAPGGLPMKRSGNEWVCSVRLAKGKHLYRFLIDGEPVRDPADPDWESGPDGDENSVLWIE